MKTHDLRPESADDVARNLRVFAKSASSSVDKKSVENALVSSGEALTSSPQQHMGADRRRSIREQRLLSGGLSDSADSVVRQQQQVTVTNLSMTGVGFQAPQALERGNCHWIVIATGSLHLSTRLRIVSVRQRGNGTFDIGGEFF